MPRVLNWICQIFVYCTTAAIRITHMMYSFEKATEHCFIEKQLKTPPNPFGRNVKNVLMLEMIESQINSPSPRGQVQRDGDERCGIFGLVKLHFALLVQNRKETERFCHST